MIQHILFDLDGTLLHFDHMQFVKNYLGLLSKKFAHLTEPKNFAQQVWQATLAMIQSTDSTKTNQQVFWEYLNTHVTLPEKETELLIEEFYNDEFHQLKTMMTIPDIQPLFDKLLAKKLSLTVATNPVFPPTAVKARLHWAGLDHVDFKLITTYDNSNYCKPNPLYFQEIITKLGAKPEECLMIGNDVTEDLAAGKIGIKTYLLTDFIINRNNAPIIADYTGTVADLTRDIDDILLK